MSVGEAALQNIVDGGAQVFGCRHRLQEFRTRVQILQIEALQNLALHETIQIHQVADHPRALVHRPADRDFERVVVTVAIRVVAFAVSCSVFRLGHGIAVQAVRGRKHVAAGQVRFHASP